MKDVKVRNLLKSDAEQIAEINKKCFTRPWSLEAMKKESKNNLASYKVLEIGEDVIGYGGFWLVMDEAEITNVAVLEEYRGQHFSKLIMVELMKTAKERGANYMTLEVRSKNQVAKNLYKDLGFKMDGMRKNYYNNPKDDCFLMSLNL